MAGWLDALQRPSVTNVPPTAAEQRRNDLIMIGVILFALFLGWGIRSNTANATTRVPLGGQLPSIDYPATWLDSRVEGEVLHAVDPASPSTFDARLEVRIRPVREGEDMDAVSMSWPLNRAQELSRFRNLANEVRTGPNEQPALLITYAYIADPTRDSGTLGLPVVVKAQDLLFIANDGEQEQLVAVTVAADATEWNDYADEFARIFASLGVGGE